MCNINNIANTFKKPVQRQVQDPYIFIYVYITFSMIRLRIYSKFMFCCYGDFPEFYLILLIDIFPSPDGYTTADVNFVWQYGDDSLEGVNNIEMAQFTLSDYKLIVKMQNFSTGKLPQPRLLETVHR